MRFYGECNLPFAVVRIVDCLSRSEQIIANTLRSADNGTITISPPTLAVIEVPSAAGVIEAAFAIKAVFQTPSITDIGLGMSGLDGIARNTAGNVFDL